MEQKNKEFLKILLEQSWLHIRHTGNHRLWFTNMYFLVVAGVLTYLSTQPTVLRNIIFHVLSSFLIVLSVFGLIICIKTDIVQKGYIDAIENIVNDTTSTEKNDCKPGYYKYLGYKQFETTGWRSISKVYEALYCISIVIWILLLGFVIGRSVLV